VQGNARLTGSVGAVIFLLLAAEGVTVPSVQSLISPHVFIGMLLVPLVALKTGTTMYRFWRYYTGDAVYVRKGPPPVILRILGPAVVVLTIAVLATGIGAIAAGPSNGWILTAHKASFILWFGAMAVHVLGHILETPALAFADWRRRTRAEAPGASTRIAVLALTIAIGLVLAVASLGWLDAWRHSGR
jgi:hypothetical protein